MPGDTIEVTAQWALWGEEEQYSRYRVLGCSDGVLSQETFRTVLTRYSPGTIATVPQVTVSWLQDSDGSYYLGMAIHDHCDDAADREAIQTSYFTVPFSALAAGAVSYTAMYNQFRAIRLPVPDGHPVAAELPATRTEQGASPPDAPSDWLAMRAAALLLTNKPVCILRAQNITLPERLRFLDTVVSLLPYGMRSQLSASTWASGTYREHKLRLFFGTAARDTDHPITWASQPDHTPINDHHADQYETWLKDGLLQCAVQLAADATQSGFSRPEVGALIARLGIRGPDLPSRPQRPPRRATRPRPDQASPGRLPDPAGASVEELLTSCVARLRERTPGSLRPVIDGLRGHLTDQAPESDQAGYRALITEFGLLHDHAISAADRADLYEVLLRLAFGMKLTYASYCEVELAVLGVRGGTKPLHRHLAELIMDRFSVDDAYVALLVLSGLGKQALAGALDALAPGDLIAMAAATTQEPRWRAGHAWVICAIIVRYLTVQRPPTTQAGRDQLKAELTRHGFLATTIGELSPDQHQYQLNMLEALLKAAYGRRLEQRDIREILADGDFAPTTALLAAVVRTANPRYIRLAIWLYAGGMLSNARFSAQVSDSLVSLLNTNNGLGADAHLGRPSQLSTRK